MTQQPVAVTAPAVEGADQGGAANPDLNQQAAATGAVAGVANPEESSNPATANATERERAAATENAAAAKTAENSDKAKTEPSPPLQPRALPAGSVGVVDRLKGVLLRFDMDKREWVKVAEGTTLAPSDRLLCFEPFWARIVVGKTPITLLGETQLQLTGKTADEPPAFELAEGKVLIDGSAPTGPMKVGFAGLTVHIDRPSQGAVGLERVSSWRYGQPPTQLPPLAIHGLEGELTLTLDGTKESLNGPDTVVADSGGRFQPRSKKQVPAWVKETEQSPKDQKLAEQFLEQFSKDRSVMEDTVLAIDNESPVTKKLAIMAVKALGDLSYVTPTLSRAGDRRRESEHSGGSPRIPLPGATGRQATASEPGRRVRRPERPDRRTTPYRLYTRRCGPQGNAAAPGRNAFPARAIAGPA